MENYINLIVAILSGLVTAIPLVVQLVKYVRAAIQEKKTASFCPRTKGNTPFETLGDLFAQDKEQE